MASKKTARDVLQAVRRGVRLKTKPPKIETPKSVYSRKIKHRRRPEDLLFFYMRFRKMPEINILQTSYLGLFC